MKASRRNTMESEDGEDYHPSQRRLTIRDNVSLAQHSTITTDSLASFLADPERNERERGFSEAEMVSSLRWKQKEEAGAAIQALNQFIFVAGHTFKGRRLDENDQKQLCQAAQQVGLSLDVVHALVEQTSDPNAILNYCLGSSDAFATRMKNDPQLSILLQQNARKVDRNGFDVADSVWRIFMHKIIQQFLKEHDMQLSDVMTKESVTRRLYEEAMRNEKKSSVDYGNDQIQISGMQRDYTKERERLKISEEDAKLARQQAEANMGFPVQRSLFGPTSDSDDYFVSSDQIITTDDMLSLRPGIYPLDDASIAASGHCLRETDQPPIPVDSIPKPTPKVVTRRRPAASDGEEEVSAVKRGLAMFEKSQTTPQKDTQRPPRKSLEALKQSGVHASKATFEGGLIEKKAVEQSQYKSSSRESITGLRASTVLKAKEKFEANHQKSENSASNDTRSPVRSITNKLSASAIKPFGQPGNKDQIHVQKPEKSRADDVDATPSKAHFVKSARERFERHHAGETSEGESKPGRPINSSSDRSSLQQMPPQRSTPSIARRFSNGDPSNDAEILQKTVPLNYQINPERFLDRPDYVVVQSHSDDSHGVISALSQSTSSSSDEDGSKSARRSSTSRTRRKPRTMILESKQQVESSVPFPRSMRELIADMNNDLLRQDIIGREQSQSDFATETTESHQGKTNPNSLLLHNTYTSTEGSMFSKPNSQYEEIDWRKYAGISSSSSRSKDSRNHRESRQDDGEGRSGFSLQRAVPQDPLMSARLDEENYVDGDGGWVEFGIGFVPPPGRMSFGGRSGRGLTEGDSDSLRQPRDNKVASKAGSTNILSEIRGIDNGVTSGKKEETVSSVLEQAENWNRRVRTLLSDEEQPSTPMFHKMQRTADASIFRDTTRTHLGNKENSPVASNPGGWTNFENSPFLGIKDKDTRTESKTQEPENDRSTTADNRPLHHLNRSTSKETSSNGKTSSHEHATPAQLKSGYSVTRDMTSPQATTERAKYHTHGKTNDIQKDSSAVVWSQETHYASQRPHEQQRTHRAMDGSTGLNLDVKKGVSSVDTRDELYGDTSHVVWSAQRDPNFIYHEEKRIKDFPAPKCATKPRDLDLPKPHQRAVDNLVAAHNRNAKEQLIEFRQDQSCDDESVDLNGMDEIVRSTSSESDFDAVNSYNECDARRIEIIQASEHVRTLGTSSVPFYDDHGSRGRAHPQQPVAPLLSNLGSRASDIMGHGSRSKGADTLLPASVVEIKRDLGSVSQTELNSLTTASNLDSIGHQTIDIQDEMDCRRRYATKCRMKQEDACEIDPNNACTIGGVAILETSFKPMNGGPPTTAPTGSDSPPHEPNDWAAGVSRPVRLHHYPEEDLQALNAYLETYEYESRTSRRNVPPHTPTGLNRPSFVSNSGRQTTGLSSHHYSERAEATSVGNKSSSPSLSEILQSNTASLDDENRDDENIQQTTWKYDARDRYLEAEPGFDENVEAPTSPTQLRSSDSDSIVDEDDFRRAAERRGLSPDLVEVLISRSNNKIRRAPLKGVDEVPHLEDNYRHHEVPIDSDTCRPASARHLRKDVGPDPYVFEQEASWNDTADDDYDNVVNPPDCPPPDPSPGEPQAILAALQQSAAEAYYNRRASLQSMPGMPELPEGASEEELNLLNRFIEVAASNFDGKKLSAESERRVRVAAEKVGLSQKFVDQLLEQANANNEARNKVIEEESPVPSVGVPTSPLYDDQSTYYTNDKTQFTKRSSKRPRDVGCNPWESLEQLSNMVRQWANCGAPGDVHEEEEDDGDRDDGSTIESDDRFRDELTKKLQRARRKSKKHRTRKSAQRGFV